MPIVTLDSIKKKGARSRSSDDEDGGGGNEYYTGGAGQGGTGSGLAVLAPNERGEGAAGGENHMRQVMERLHREQAARGGGAAPAPSGTRRVANVVVYRNGFTVDNGPLRGLDDPRNQTFIDSLTQGYCPEELVQNGQPADVRLENKLEEDYAPPRGRNVPEFAAFGGVGAAVGEIALTAVPAITPGTQGSEAPSALKDVTGEIVKVQIKYPDGRKEVAKFEKHHTVRHLISRVEASQPNLRHYHLLSGDRGPPKPVAPELFDATITDAGLAGALVTVKEIN